MWLNETYRSKLGQHGMSHKRMFFKGKIKQKSKYNYIFVEFSMKHSFAAKEQRDACVHTAATTTLYVIDNND